MLFSVALLLASVCFRRVEAQPPSAGTGSVATGEKGAVFCLDSRVVSCYALIMNYACPLRIRYGTTGQQGEALPCVRRYGTGGGQGAPLSAGTVPVVISGAGVIFLRFYTPGGGMRSVALNRIDTARICPESGRLPLAP